MSTDWICIDIGRVSISLTFSVTLQLVGTNYQASLLKYIDKENLPEYLGGTSKATLLDDVGPWQTQSIIDEIDADYRAALSGSKDVEADSTKGE